MAGSIDTHTQTHARTNTDTFALATGCEDATNYLQEQARLLLMRDPAHS